MLNETANPTEMFKWLSERNLHIPAEELAFMLGIHLKGDNASDPLDPFDFDDDDYGEFHNPTLADRISHQG